MKWNLWNRIVTAAALCALFLLAGSHGVSAAEWIEADADDNAELAVCSLSFEESSVEALQNPIAESRQNPVLESLVLRSATRTLAGSHQSE